MLSEGSHIIDAAVLMRFLLIGLPAGAYWVSARGAVKVVVSVPLTNTR